MPGGKKKSKSKGKTVALTEFLQNEDGSVPVPVPTGGSSWAVEMENADVDDGDEPRPTFDRSKLPTAPKAARGPDIDVDRIPDKGPFTAFVGNLSYDVSEEKIAEFFVMKNLEVVNVRLPNENGRQRGFGYVEFGSKEALINALTLNEEMLCGRKLRVDLAESSGGDRERGDNSGRSDREDWRGGGDPNRTEGDWRRRDPPSFNNDDRRGDRDRGFSDRSGGGFNDRRGGGYNDRERNSGFSDRGSDRQSDRDSYGDRRGFSDRGSDGDRRGFSDRDRGFSDRSGGGFGDRSGGRDRYNGEGGGFSRRDGDRYERRGFEDRRGGGYNDRYGGRQDDKGFGGRRGEGGVRREDEGGRSGYREERADHGGSREGSQEAPRERRRLNLQPRTKPVDKSESEPSRQSSIFGSAKPVDTAAKEREIEEKMKKLDTTIHFTSEEKDTYVKDSYRDVREGAGRPRRDSDRSDGGRGGGRERRLSSSSSKTGTSRRDSETSRTSDDSHPPEKDSKPLNKEERKMVPAPPPKENAWSRPRNDATSRPAEPTRQLSSGSSESQEDRNSHNSTRREDHRSSEESLEKTSNCPNL